MPRLIKKIVYVYEAPKEPVREKECECDEEDCKICDPDYEEPDRSPSHHDSSIDDVSMTDDGGDD